MVSSSAAEQGFGACLRDSFSCKDTQKEARLYCDPGHTEKLSSWSSSPLQIKLECLTMEINRMLVISGGFTKRWFASFKPFCPKTPSPCPPLYLCTETQEHCSGTKGKRSTEEL